ncbi:MAG: hypothetical protein ACF8SC_13200 [Phycisphaerales bacterium JB037]
MTPQTPPNNPPQSPPANSGQDRSTLVIALVGSLTLHALAVLALSGVARAAQSPDRALDPPDPPLGIESSRAVTVTWLGFEDPTPHQAPRSLVEQPEQSLAAAASPPNEPSEQSPAEPVSQPEPAPDPATNPRDAAPAIRLVQPAVLNAAPAVAVGDFRLPPTPPKPTPQQAQQPSQPANPAPSNPAPEPAKPTPPTPAESDPRPADRPADRESDAASRHEPTEFKLGDPVAAQGLRIDTRVPPRHSIQTRLVGARRRPVFEVSFRKDGTVAFVEIIQSSGDPDVDEPWRNALYEWKASGSELDALPENDPAASLKRRFTPVPIPG